MEMTKRVVWRAVPFEEALVTVENSLIPQLLVPLVRPLQFIDWLSVDIGMVPPSQVISHHPMNKQELILVFDTWEKPKDPSYTISIQS